MKLAKAAAVAAGLTLAINTASAQPPLPLTSYSEAALRAEVARSGTEETKLLIKMRDGIGLSTDIIRPKADGKYPTIFIRTPYNMNTRSAGDLRTAVEAQ